MSLWKVKVRCAYQDRGRRMKYMHELCLVDASCSSGAILVATDFVESNAPVDRRWTEFKATETTAVVLPMHI